MIIRNGSWLVLMVIEMTTMIPILMHGCLRLIMLEMISSTALKPMLMAKFEAHLLGSMLIVELAMRMALRKVHCKDK